MANLARRLPSSLRLQSRTWVPGAVPSLLQSNTCTPQCFARSIPLRAQDHLVLPRNNSRWVSTGPTGARTSSSRPPPTAPPDGSQALDDILGDTASLNANQKQELIEAVRRGNYSARSVGYKYISARNVAAILALFGLAFTASAVAGLSSDVSLNHKLQSERAGNSGIDAMYKQFRQWLHTGHPFVRTDIQLLRRAWAYHRADKMGEYYKSLMAAVSSLPDEVQQVVSRSWLELSNWYANCSSAQLAMIPVIAINAGVFLAFRIPALKVFMDRHFIDRGGSGKVYTMVTSAFAHQAPLHFALNSMALWSFSALAIDTAGYKDDYRKATGTDKQVMAEISLTSKLFGFFVCAGLASSLVSRVGHNLSAAALLRRATQVLQAGINGGRNSMSLHQVHSAARSTVQSGSLGASGVAYALVTLTAMTRPEGRVHLPLLPDFTVGIQDGVRYMIYFDLFGLVTGLTKLNHLAHLGGAAFGYWWYCHGERLWQAVRESYTQFEARHRFVSGSGANVIAQASTAAVTQRDGRLV